MSSPKIKALALINDPALTVSKADVKKLQDVIIHQFGELKRSEKMDAARFVLLGLMLHCLKASLPHGKFQPWVKCYMGNIWSEGTAIKNASLSMRLALAFVDKAKVQKPDLLALPSGNLELDLSTGHPSRGLTLKLDGFVGEMTRAELIEKYVTSSGGSGGGDDSALPVINADEQFFADLAERLYGFREVILKRESLVRLDPKQLDTIKTELASTVNEFNKLYAEARGKRKGDA